MRSHVLVLAATLIVTTPGCHGGATHALWSQVVPVQPRPIEPTAIERGVRTGDGAVHLELECADGETRHVVVRGYPERSAQEWPGRHAVTAVLSEEPLPDGVGFAIASGDEPPAPSDRPTLRLLRSTLVVHDPGGTSRVLLAFPCRTLTALPALQPGLIVLAVVTTPLALVADLVLGPL